MPPTKKGQPVNVYRSAARAAQHKFRPAQKPCQDRLDSSCRLRRVPPPGSYCMGFGPDFQMIKTGQRMPDKFRPTACYPNPFYAFADTDIPTHQGLTVAGWKRKIVCSGGPVDPAYGPGRPRADGYAILKVGSCTNKTMRLVDHGSYYHEEPVPDDQLAGISKMAMDVGVGLIGLLGLAMIARSAKK